MGVDPKLVPLRFEKNIEKFKEFGIEIVFVEENLVDLQWKMVPEVKAIKVHPELYSGSSSQKKIDDLRKKGIEEEIIGGIFIQIVFGQELIGPLKFDYIILSALDDVAWLLNLRGDDVLFSPVFKSFCAIHREKFVVTLCSS